MRKGPRRLLVFALFTALVLVLLWFQGLLFRGGHEPGHVAALETVSATAKRVKVALRPVPGAQVLPGFVEAVDPAEIAPRVLATITKVTVREGEDVKKGAVLATLDDRDAANRLAQAKAAQAAAKSAHEQAQLAFDRAQRLLDRQAATAQEWEAARAANEVAAAEERRAKEAVAEAETARSWYKLTAPFDGRVLARSADPGQLATPGRPVLTLYRAGQQRFAVAVPEDRAAQFTPGSRHTLEFDAAAERAATLTRVLPASDARTGTVTLHLEPESLDGLRPGLMGRLRVATGDRQALAVPTDAVQHIGQVERVRLVRDGAVVPVTVRTGKAAAGWTEVLGGLREGDEVLVP